MAKGRRRSKKGYFLTPFVIGLTVFVIGNHFLNSQPSCANSRTCKNDLSLKIENDAVGFFAGRPVIPPKIELAQDIIKPSVLGTNLPDGEKHIYVNLATQTLHAYQGDKQIMKTLIASGKWGRTPIGNFNIWSKLRATRMAGGSGADYYNLPNVPHTMYFYNDFAIHGAYWHNNFGHEMSHGCVNMRLVDAEALFAWADGPTSGKKGTTVSVCNEFEAPNLCVQNNPVN